MEQQVYGNFTIKQADMIRRCPFCGGWAYLRNDYDQALDRTYSRIMCGMCGSSGKAEYTSGYYEEYVDAVKDSELRAMRSWNTRRETS